MGKSKGFVAYRDDFDRLSIVTSDSFGRDTFAVRFAKGDTEQDAVSALWIQEAKPGETRYIQMLANKTYSADDINRLFVEYAEMRSQDKSELTASFTEWLNNREVNQPDRGYLQMGDVQELLIEQSAQKVETKADQDYLDCYVKHELTQLLEQITDGGMKSVLKIASEIEEIRDSIAEYVEKYCEINGEQISTKDREYGPVPLWIVMRALTRVNVFERDHAVGQIVIYPTIEDGGMSELRFLKTATGWAFLGYVQL